MRRLPALLLAGLLLCSLPTYAALGDDMLPTVQRTTSHRYLIRGEYDREETLDTAVISAERVELENKAITGDLTIDSMVGEGPVAGRGRHRSGSPPAEWSGDCPRRWHRGRNPHICTADT